MSKTRLIIAFAFITILGSVFFFDLDRYLTLEFFNARQAEINNFVAINFGMAVIGYFLIYVAATALNIPGAAIMTLIAGAIFGLTTGTIIVSFASSIGATLAFILSRFLLREYVESRFGMLTEKVNRGVNKEGAYYLFTLRLVPLFPFFAINMVMGLTRLRAKTFYWVSQLGMLPGTVVYVNAGTQLGQVESTGDILSPVLLGSFVLLGIFPLLAKNILALINRRRRLKNFTRPKQFDTNLVVIGAGAAGLVTAYVAAAAKAKVTLVEEHQMGGDCLNTGCVPSKALIRSARIASYLRRAEEFGLYTDNLRVNFPRLMARIKQVIERIAPHDSIERYTRLGVDCVTGAATITSPWSVSVNGKTITTRSIVIATGGRPAVPPIPGIKDAGYLTSDTIWDLTALPSRFLILGGGPIGCELAQAFARLGSAVTIVEMLPRLLTREDTDVSEKVQAHLEADGVRVLTGHKATEFQVNGALKLARCENDGVTQDVEFDELLVATGRRANTENIGLAELGIELDADGTVSVNEFLQTDCPNIYACGDVTGPYQLTHAAGHQGWYCAMNALFGRFKRFRVDYSVLPWAVFTDPEVARVGLNEQEAREKNIDVEVTRYGIDDLDRAIADSEAHGFVKILTPPGRDRILGVTIVGPHAGDLIAEFVSAMRNGLGLKKVLNTIHIYPTLAEANRYAAGEWQKSHLPERALAIATRYHGWLRG
jgi:dihydrolipoamide dehydrogenase